MKKTFATCLLFLLLFAPIFGQNLPKASRATIFLDGRPANDLARLGIEADHGILSPGVSVTSDFSERELAMVRAAGFRVAVEIDDVADFYSKQNKDAATSPRGPSNCPDYEALWPTPANWSHGSMGGYFTLSEMEAVLDLMHDKFPNLISKRKDCSQTISTWEGRKLQWVRISDNPEADEPSEPEVLYTAVHHAREPLGMSQMLLFMWYLLENYATDPEIKFMVDNEELCFIPCVNPDGYVFNEATNPDGGGFWRKNRRDNGGGSFGVDLNRNYGHQWGFDDIGSSPDPESEVYRGPAGFSEPETQTVRDFCKAHQFKLALNYHTWGNLLIHPWGWADAAPPDSVKFRRLARWLTAENRFNSGLATQTVGYQVNGSSDDWQYGGPGILALTPEVGRVDGFWPPDAEIDALSKSTMWMNLTLARFALDAAQYEDRSPAWLPNVLAGKLDFDLHFMGLDPKVFTVSIAPVSPNVLTTGGAQNFSLGANEKVSGSFSYQLSQNVQPGDKLKFAVTVTNGGLFTHHFLLEKTYGGKKSTPLDDALDNTGNFDNAGTWGLNYLDFHSPPTSMGDSPDDVYPEFWYNFMSTSTPVHIPSDAVEARLRFWAKWDIAARYEFAEIYANGIPLCGRYTNFGTEWQSLGQPIYDGFQPDWVEESMDLSEHLGEDVIFSFLMNSGGGGLDGFNFDDLRVEILQKNNAVGTVDLDGQLSNTWAQPNPARLSTTLFWNGPAGDKLLIFNQLGQLYKTVELPASASNNFHLDLTGWPSGVYFWKTTDGATASEAQRLVVGR